MTLHRFLTIISCLILLYCALILFFTLAPFFTNGLSKAPLSLILLGTLTLAFAVTLVSSYRQLLRQRPKLVLSALFLIIVSQIISFISLQHLMNDPLTVDMNEAVKNGIREGLENGTIPRDRGFEEQLIDINLTIASLLKTIGFYLCLFIIPIYTNFRKTH